MEKCAVFRTENYDDEILCAAVKKHFEIHRIADEISADTKVLLKPNLVTDKEAVFSVTTNPAFVYAVVRCLRDIGVKNITVADCPGGSLLMFSDMTDIYRRTGYDFLSEYACLNTCFESRDIPCQSGFSNTKFNIINAVSDADYIINLPKLKTHNLTCITAGVKNLFGCIPGLQKPAYHAKYPSKADFSNMLVELAATVKPDFTIVDAVDIMEGNGPTNGKKRHLGATFSSKDVFTLDKFICEILGIADEKVTTLAASERKGFIDEIERSGDVDFRPEIPVLLPGYQNAQTVADKIKAKMELLISKADGGLFMNYPHMNEKCMLCRKCVSTCPVKALSVQNKKVTVDKDKCIGCLCCDEVCPHSAVDIRKKLKKKR